MATAAQLTTRIASLEERIATIAGVDSTSIGDQSTSFDLEGAQRQLALWRAELAQLQSTTGSRTRYAAFDKGV